MRRHWQWIVLLVGFFFLVIDFEALASPFPSLVWTFGFSTRGLLTLMAIHLAGIVWVLVQKNAIDGGSTAIYTRTLPIPDALEWRTVLSILLLSDSLFWAYLALPLVFHLQQSDSLVAAAALIGLLANVAMLLLIVQLHWLQGARLALPVVLIVDYGIAEVFWRLRPGLSVAVLVVTAALLFAVMLRPVKSRQPTIWPWLGGFSLRLAAWREAGGLRLPGILVVQHRILFHENLMQAMLRTTGAGLIAVTAWAIIGFGGRIELGYDLLVITGCLSALLVSGLFRTLDEAHAQVRPYLRTLPIRPLELPTRDVLYLGLVCSWIMVPLSLIFVDRGWATGAEVGISSLAWLGLLALLQPLSTLTRHHTVVIASGATLGWILLMLLP